jgi:hypothetical protein
MFVSASRLAGSRYSTRNAGAVAEVVVVMAYSLSWTRLEGGRRGSPAALLSAAHAAGGSGSSERGGKFPAEHSGPEGTAGKFPEEPLDAEGRRAKLRRSPASTAPPQAGPL